jgi:hypothetical protein
MTGAGARITAGACVGALALTPATAWSGAPGGAREVVAEAVGAGARAAEGALAWAGWARSGAGLERGDWAVRAEALERTPTGWLARGDVRVLGPGGLVVRAPRVEFDAASARATSTPESAAALVGAGWTLEGARVEVDLASASARVVELGSRDEMTR